MLLLLFFFNLKFHESFSNLGISLSWIITTAELRAKETSVIEIARNWNESSCSRPLACRCSLEMAVIKSWSISNSHLWELFFDVSEVAHNFIITSLTRAVLRLFRLFFLQRSFSLDNSTDGSSLALCFSLFGVYLRNSDSLTLLRSLVPVSKAFNSSFQFDWCAYV